MLALLPVMALPRASALAATTRLVSSRVLFARGGANARMGTVASSPSVDAAVPLTSASLIASDAEAAEWTGDLMVVPFYEAAEKDKPIELSPAAAALDEALSGALTDLIADAEFEGKAGSSAVVALGRGLPLRRLALVGLGKSGELKQASARKFGASVASVAKEAKAKKAAALLPSDAGGGALTSALQQAAMEAALLALSPDMRFKASGADAADTKLPALEELHVLGGADPPALSRARSVSAGVLLTRGLVASPANYVTPTALASAAKGLADEFGTMRLTVLEQKQIEARGMGAYLGVSQGASEPPKFIHLTYSPKGGATRKVALIGKGLTFDSGGYNIKARPPIH